MALYRIYRLDHTGHIEGPPLALTCASDADAVDQGMAWSGGMQAEVWEAARLVGRIGGAAPARHLQAAQPHQ